MIHSVFAKGSTTEDCSPGREITWIERLEQDVRFGNFRFDPIEPMDRFSAAESKRKEVSLV